MSAEPPSATPITSDSERPVAGMRLWFAAYVLWMITLTVVALSAFERFEAGEPWAGFVWTMALMCFYLSLCNALLPAPTAWIVMFAASDYFAELAPLWVRIGVVAVVGGCATAMANLNEYHLLGHRAGRRLRDRVRRTRVYQWAIRWFDRAPFQTLLLIAFIPLPIDGVRWLAILRRYPRGRFALAYFVGRSARYVLLTSIAVAANLTWWEILLVQIGVALGGGLIWRLMRTLSTTVNNQRNEQTVPQESATPQDNETSPIEK